MLIINGRCGARWLGTQRANKTRVHLSESQIAKLLKKCVYSFKAISKVTAAAASVWWAQWCPHRRCRPPWPSQEGAPCNPNRRQRTGRRAVAAPSWTSSGRRTCDCSLDRCCRRPRPGGPWFRHLGCHLRCSSGGGRSAVEKTKTSSSEISGAAWSEVAFPTRPRLLARSIQNRATLSLCFHPRYDHFLHSRSTDTGGKEHVERTPLAMLVSITLCVIWPCACLTIFLM